MSVSEVYNQLGGMNGRRLAEVELEREGAALVAERVEAVAERIMAVRLLLGVERVFALVEFLALFYKYSHQ